MRTTSGCKARRRLSELLQRLPAEAAPADHAPATPAGQWLSSPPVVRRPSLLGRTTMSPAGGRSSPSPSATTRWRLVSDRLTAVTAAVEASDHHDHAADAREPSPTRVYVVRDDAAPLLVAEAPDSGPGSGQTGGEESGVVVRATVESIANSASRGAASTASTSAALRTRPGSVTSTTSSGRTGWATERRRAR